MKVGLSADQLARGVLTLAKREKLEAVTRRTVVFQSLAQKYPTKNLEAVLEDSFGGGWGDKPDEAEINVPTLRSPDIRNGFIDAENAEIRSFSKRDIDRIALILGDILVIKSNGSFDLVGKSQLFNIKQKAPVTFSNFLMALRPNKKLVSPRYLDQFLKSAQALSWRLSEQKTTTGLRNLKTKEYLQQQLPLPPMEYQELIADVLEQPDIVFNDSLRNLIPYDTLKSLKAAANFSTDHGDELSSQATYLTQLRQAILQEAIEGKLTAAWRKEKKSLTESTKPTKGSSSVSSVPFVRDETNDAAVLLEKIRQEKMALARGAKTAKKEKELPPLEPGEVPFALPEGWVWTRLGEITQIKGGKRVDNGYKLLKQPTRHIYIRVSDMKNGTIDDSDLHYIDDKMFAKINRYIISKDDLYMTIVGGTIGKCGVVPDKFHNMNLTENAARIILHQVNKLFVLKCLQSDFGQRQFIDKTKQVGVQKMALNRFASTLIPLPPLAEQHAIVERVDRMLAMVDQLEQQVAERQVQAEELMQAVLREAFSQDAGGLP